MKKFTFKEALRLNIDELVNLKRNELEAVYAKLQKTTSSRVATYRRNASMNAAAIRKVKNLRKSPRGFRNKRELARAVFQMQLFLGGDESTYAKHQERMKEFRKLMEDRTGIKFRTAREYEKYREVVDSIMEAHPEMKGAYKDIQELYKEVTRLGVDMREPTFRKNTQFWLDHLDDLKTANPVGKRMTPSRLLKDLNLPEIPDEDQED